MEENLWVSQEARMCSDNTALVDLYLEAKKTVIDGGYEKEIDWQNNLQFSEIIEGDFLREAGWVILSCGMRESVIRQKFPMISGAFFEWESAEKIVYNSGKCFEDAIRHFGHEKKIRAIIKVAEDIFNDGFETVCDKIESEGIGYIAQWPYMGPATSYHFAKNLGLPVAKPDRHLKRIASALGSPSPQILCETIADVTGEKVSVIDLVLWRFATLERNYLSLFSRW